MTQQDTLALEHFSLASPQIGPESESESEISLLDVVALLLRHKRMIGGVAAIATVLAIVGVLLLPPSYVAEATILPPQQQQSSLAAMAAGAMGGLAGSMGSQLGLKNPADLYIGILKSRTISDGIINRFHLKDVYHAQLQSESRKTLGSKASFASGKDSLITISVKDRDPKRAADIANAYIDELHDQNSRLALTDASQRRLFFEQQLVKEKDALANAEVALKATEQSTGLLAPGGQAEVLIRSGAQFRAEIASREVQLQAMRAFATDENPQVQTLKREISALQGQLSQVEANGSGSKFEVSGGRMPQASLEYIRKLRDVKYHETLFELLSRQYEAARIDEAKQAPVIQIVDRAVVPDKQTRPSRGLVVLGAMFAGFAMASVAAFLVERVGKLRLELRQAVPIGSGI
jgi:tyrosine-protein kinase Etk/Wzc